MHCIAVFYGRCGYHMIPCDLSIVGPVVPPGTGLVSVTSLDDHSDVSQLIVVMVICINTLVISDH